MPESGTPGPARLPVEVRRSARRKRTVSADIRDGVIRISIPGHFSAGQERHWVERMTARMSAKYLDAPAIADDQPVPALLQRAERLAHEYLGGRGVPMTIGWVTNQNSRWASATPAYGSVRLSHRLQGMPEWVVDYVILHEMAHLIEPSHSAVFWGLLASYPRIETAKAFLDGAAFAAHRNLTGRLDEL